MKHMGVWVGVLFLLSFGPFVFAQAGITHSESYYGTVTVDGSNASAGSVITAATSTNSHSITVSPAGQYGGGLVSQDKLLGEGAIGATVTFTLTNSGCTSVNTLSDTLNEATHSHTLAFTTASGSGCSSSGGTTTSGTTSGSSGGAGGSSSGGGGGAAGENANIEATKTKLFSSIANGETVTMAVDVPEIGIIALRILFNEGGSNIAITVNSLISRPGELESPSDKVYQYLEIKLSDNADTSQIQSVDIDFKVKDSWITANTVDPSTIVLFRWTIRWNELPTIKTSTDSAYSYYTATSPGLSTFAIGVSNKAKPTETTPTTPTPTTPPTTPAEDIGKIAGKEGSSNVGIIIILAIVVLGLAGYVFYIKKKK